MKTKQADIDADPFGTGADVYFAGEVPDWRNRLEDIDPDDEQIDTPAEVIAILGFDPTEIESEETNPDLQFAEAGPTDSVQPTADAIVHIGTSAASERLAAAAARIRRKLKKKRPI